MKKINFLLGISLVISLLLFPACEKNDEQHIALKISNLESDDYFPLHLGDYWKLDFLPKRTIDKMVRIENKDYFQQISEYDTIFYRKTSDGKVFLKAGMKDEVLKFDLNAPVGETWTYKYDASDYVWNATLTSKNETVSSGNYTFHNCYSFYFDVPELADEEHIIWLAPGIGIVEEAYLGGSSDRKKIKQVNINDIEIRF